MSILKLNRPEIFFFFWMDEQARFASKELIDRIFIVRKTESVWGEGEGRNR